MIFFRDAVCALYLTMTANIIIFLCTMNTETARKFQVCETLGPK